MKCVECGHKMSQQEGAYKYDESGLKDIVLMNVPMHKCPSCGDSAVEIPHMDELHLVLGFLVALQPTGLSGDKARYLRKHLGYSQEELADRLGVTRVTVARWEDEKKILKPGNDKHIRRLYVEKKANEFASHPSMMKVVSVLVDRLPQNRKQMRIRKEDWTSLAPASPGHPAHATV